MKTHIEFYHYGINKEYRYLFNGLFLLVDTHHHSEAARPATNIDQHWRLGLYLL